MSTYRMNDDVVTEEFEARSDKRAMEHAREWLRDGAYDEDKTHHLSALVERKRRSGWEDVGVVRVTLEPRAPDCVDGEHDWQRPHRLVGGVAENPGVFGHGGGVVICECCMRCGAKHRTDTGASDDSGQQCTEVTYEDPGYYVLEEEVGA
jgi:hypothetical protein